MSYCLYRHINKSTFETFYIGIGSKKRAFDFINRNKHWKEYVETNGQPVVIVDAEYLSLKTASEMEIELIKFFRTICFIANITNGGDGAFFGGHTISTRIKMSQSKIGKKIPRFVVEKIAKSNRGKKRTNQAKKNIGIKSIGRNSKLVLNRSYGIFYDSIKEAAKSSTTSASYFQQQLNGNRKNKTDFILL